MNVWSQARTKLFRKNALVTFGASGTKVATDHVRYRSSIIPRSDEITRDRKPSDGVTIRIIPPGFKIRLHSSSMFLPSSKETCSIMCSEYIKSNDPGGISKLLVASSFIQASPGGGLASVANHPGLLFHPAPISRQWGPGLAR